MFFKYIIFLINKFLGWKPIGNSYDGIKWDIEIKKDEEDVF
tara:strand:+ start:1165 stop:1287 length:123 start_codon:yes stop_codon:yes gene_type:complete